MEEFYLDANENAKLCVRLYRAENPKAVVQVLHGMCEHQGRYEYFANILVKHGFIVVTSDMRGHGRSIKDSSELGYFGKNGEKNLIDDQVIINTFIKNNFPELKVYMFAHSMGTLIARNFLKEHDNLIDKLVLSGAPYFSNLANFGKIITGIVKNVSGRKNRSKLLKNILFSAIPKSQRIDNSWISYDLENIQNYNNDNMCGFMFTNEGYDTLAKLDADLVKYKEYKVKNKDLPILFLSGEEDIIVGGAKNLSESVKTLLKVGYKNVSSKVYSNMKHEIINEANKDIVISDILNAFNFS